MWWLRRYLPKSLLGRALTILAAPIIRVQVIAIWIFFAINGDAVTRNAARSLAGEIGLALTLIETSGDGKQRQAAIELAERYLSINVIWRSGGKLGPAIRHMGIDTRAGSELLVAMQPLGVPFQIDAETLPRQIRVVVAGNTGVLEVVATRRKLG